MAAIDRVGMLGVLGEHRSALLSALDALPDQAGALAELANGCIDAIRTGHTILVAGNGGSAAEAQHFSAELIGRFRRERRPYPAIALTTDSSILTALANDYGYDEIFARQVAGLGKPGDLFIALSTSGESENLVKAMEEARRCSLKNVALIGPKPCRMADLADLAVRAPGHTTAIVQELHLGIVHLLCELIEGELEGG